MSSATTVGRIPSVDLKDKLPHLINDTLLALCGVRLGAVVYTANEEDFALVQHYKRFRFEVV